MSNRIANKSQAGSILLVYPAIALALSQEALFIP